MEAVQERVFGDPLEDFQALLQLLPQLRFKPSLLGNLCTGSKGLDHWTLSGALYFWDRGRALLHIAPPSIEVAEQRCVNMLVSE